MVRLWIVKMAHDGGLIKGKIEQKKILTKEKIDEKDFPNTLEYYSSKRGHLADYCIKDKKAVTLGWTLKPSDSWKKSNETIDKDTYNSFVDTYKKFEDGWDAKKLQSTLNKFQSIEKDGLCWVRDDSDTYYIGKVEGAWEYYNTPDDWAWDIAQGYRCKFKKVGDATMAPGEVVKTLITRGDTVKEVTDNDLIELSIWLFDNGGKIAINNAVNDFDLKRYKPDDILNNITEYEYEDLVGFYLQSKGYFIMPSTRYQSTKDYEFVAFGNGEKAVVQVKYTEGKTDLRNYEELSKTYRMSDHDNVKPLIAINGRGFYKSAVPKNPEYGKRSAVERMFSRLKEVFEVSKTGLSVLRKYPYISIRV